MYAKITWLTTENLKNINYVRMKKKWKNVKKKNENQMKE